MVNDNQKTGINSVMIFHQNICGLRGKTDELTSSLSPNFPHILCFSEHHLQKFELNQMNVEGYSLGAAYSRQVVKRGGVCIFVHKILNYTTIDLSAIVQFPTRTQSHSSTAIDNLFIDTYKFLNYTVSPLYNGLSDHDAQLLTINDANLQSQNHRFHIVRNINKYTIEEFKTRLSHESWENIFVSNGNMDVRLIIQHIP
jgi:hypothetical protein